MNATTIMFVVLMASAGSMMRRRGGMSARSASAPCGSILSSVFARCFFVQALTILLCASSAAGALPHGWERGVDLSAYWWTDLRGEPFQRSLTDAKLKAHARTVTLVVTWYQPSAAETTIARSRGSKAVCRGSK